MPLYPYPAKWKGQAWMNVKLGLKTDRLGPG